MKRTRRKFSSSFKALVAIQALKERETLSELTVCFELYPNQISEWKQEFYEEFKSILDKSNEQKKMKRLIWINYIQKLIMIF